MTDTEKQILGKVNSLDDRIEKMIKVAGSTKENVVKASCFLRNILVGLIMLITIYILWNFFPASIIENLVNKIFEPLYVFTSNHTLLFNFNMYFFIDIFKQFLIYVVIYFNIFFLLPLNAVFNTEDISKKILNIEKNFTIFYVIFVVVFYLISFTIYNPDHVANPINIISDKQAQIEESYSMCVFKNMDNPLICNQDRRKAQESQKTDYSLELLPQTKSTYTLDQIKSFPVNYQIKTKGGSIKLEKFECYIDDKKEPVYVQDLQGKVLRHEIEKQLNLKCPIEIEKLDSRFRYDFKIRPVLYYSIDTTVTHSIPIVDMSGYSEDDIYIKENRYIINFRELSPIMSDNIFKITSTWYPDLPLFFGQPEYDSKTYSVDFVIQKNDYSQARAFGDMISSNITSLKIPTVFDYGCDNKIEETCEKELYITEQNGNQQMNLNLNLKLKTLPLQKETLEIIQINITSEMKKSSTIYINLEDRNFKAEEPVAEEPKVEEPKVEDPKVEEPKAEEPKAEEPKAEEPKAEEPKAEEPVAEEPVAEEPEVVQ